MLLCMITLRRIPKVRTELADFHLIIISFLKFYFFIFIYVLNRQEKASCFVNINYLILMKELIKIN